MAQDLSVDLPDEVIATLTLEAQLPGCKLDEPASEIIAAHADTPVESQEADKEA